MLFYSLHTKSSILQQKKTLAQRGRMEHFGLSNNKIAGQAGNDEEGLLILVHVPILFPEFEQLLKHLRSLRF